MQHEHEGHQHSHGHVHGPDCNHGHDEDEGDESGDGVLSAMFPNAAKAVPKTLTPELKQLWKDHRKGDTEARNRLIEEYFGIVEANVANVINTIIQAVEDSDFHSAGMVGFLESFDEFKDGSGVSFEDFSSLKIRQAILNELNSFIAE